MKIDITITFESDWHVGHGASAVGHIDRIVRRHPEDDLPYVPAKTLTGILRDACERVAGGLDEGKDGPWQEFVAEMFGYQSKGVTDASTTTAARLAIGPARLDEALRQALKANPTLKDALTFVKPGISLNENGIAIQGMLRLEEVVLAGAVLCARAELVMPESARDAALAILTSGARAVDRLGGKRRRGNGRCRIAIHDAPANISTILAAAPPDFEKTSSKVFGALPEVPVAEAGEWHVIELELDIITPVVVPAETLGNVVSTRDHIPGSLLLPALDKKLRRMLGSRSGELTGLLASAMIQIRNAYPEGSGERMIPVPAALMAEKENPANIINSLFELPDDSIQRKQLRMGYLPAGGLPNVEPGHNPVHSVKLTSSTHATIDDEKQRPTEDVGGVFTYEAIRAGQKFSSQILISKSVMDILPELSMFEEKIRIGRAKKDDYGQVTVRASVGNIVSAEIHGSTFDLMLASPLLARDEKLRPITDQDAFARWLGKKLGTGLVCEAVSSRAFRDDGWNNAWNEPRPTRFGIAAGSSFRFGMKGDMRNAIAMLQKIEKEGLGERRGEGYGEVKINPSILLAKKPPVLSEHSLQVRENQISADKYPNLRLKQTAFTAQLLHRAWRKEIRRRAYSSNEFHNDISISAKKPGSSQLGALRSIFEGNYFDVLDSWLVHLRETKNRESKWSRKTLELLDKFAKNKDEIWTYINVEDLPGLEGHDIRSGIATEATRIFWLTAISLASEGAQGKGENHGAQD